MRTQQSWDPVASWYDHLVGEKGQYFHEAIIFPSLTALLQPKKGMRILDLACGQGAYARHLASRGALVTAVDASSELLKRAKEYSRNGIEYRLDDARVLRTVPDESQDHVVCILALQNIDPLLPVLQNCTRVLRAGGSLLVVILHPAFRSPRITGWGEDPARKLQFRRIDRYQSSLKIPITMHPGKKQSTLTWTYHRPLADYVNAAASVGLVVDHLDEWCSDKTSIGTHAKAENLARKEIPLFLAIRYRKPIGNATGS